MQKLNMWLKQSAKYPVSELFGSIDNPNTKQKKAEKRITEICEELYRFSVVTLSDVRAAYRDIQVLVNTGIDAKYQYTAKIVGRVAYFIDVAVPALDAMHKQDQQLQQYYKAWAVKSKDLKDELKSFLIDKYPNEDKVLLLDLFNQSYDDTKKEQESK